MWELSIPWYDIVIRATLIYFIFFTLFRVIGKKHTGELSRFDLILLLIISELVESAIIQNDKSITAVIIGATSLITLSVLFDKLAFYFPRFDVLLNGRPVEIIKEGKIIQDKVSKEEISMNDIHEALRMNGINEIKEVKLAVLETNGKISIVKFEK